MKPVKNTVPAISAGQRIKHKDWSLTGLDTDYYEIGRVQMRNGIPEIYLKYYDVSYLLEDLNMWEIK